MEGNACSGLRWYRSNTTTYKTITEEFGVQHVGPNADVATHMAMASILYDTENLVPIDSQIASYELIARDLLKKQLSYIEKGDLLLLDRGYPAQWLFSLLYAKNLQFCIRLSDFKRSAAALVGAEAFSRSKLRQTIVQINLPKKDRSHLDRYPEFYDKELSVRLVKVVLSTGETEILCTSLLDDEQFPISDF
jgi:hypothetical protein